MGHPQGRLVSRSVCLSLSLSLSLLPLSCLRECECIAVCVHVCCVCVYVCRCRWARGHPKVSSSLGMLSICCRQDLSLVGHSLVRLDWVANKPRGSASVCLFSAGMPSTYYHTLNFYVHSEGSHSDPPACLLSLQSPWPLLFLFCLFETSSFGRSV